MQIYLVGGAVRDTLLGMPSDEKDWVVVGTTAADMVAKGFKPVGRHFPVFIHPDSGEEYALARTERKTAPGYHGFEFDASPEVSLAEDLKRRDLTVNAMAFDANERLIDPWGGLDDLKNRKLRHVSDAFAEDPVRILRAARFAAKLHALGFVIVAQTQALMQKMVAAGEADHLVAERVWQEAEKTLEGENPSVFFGALNQAGALQKTFPELEFLTKSAACARILDDCAANHPPATLFAALALLARASGASLLPLCHRLKLKQDYHRLAALAIRNGGRLMQAADMSEAEALDVIERNDALRKTSVFDTLLTACLLCEQTTPVGAERLRRAIATLKKIDFKTELKDYDQDDIRERVRKIRLAALKGI